MIKQAAACPEDTSSKTDKRTDARDLLAHLYREIGISAVAAALCVTVSKDREQDSTVSNSVSAQPKSDIAA